MRSALIFGITGQDGSYLAELLVAQGYRVIGVTRRSVDDARRAIPSKIAHLVELTVWDMMDGAQLKTMFQAFRPSEVFNCAAYTSGTGMFDDPAAIGLINGIAIAHILEGIRTVDPRIRFCQASSSEIFAEATESPQSEITPFAPRSPYGSAKCYADYLVRCYRKQFGLFACSAILFNHESPRRRMGFVTRKIAHEAVRIKRGFASQLRLGNLYAARDWGFAGDAVRAMALMLQASTPEDFVVATGQIHTVRDFCDLAFRCLGMDYRDHVVEDPAEVRPVEAVQLIGDARKARRVLGWEPTVGFEELVAMMIDAELRSIHPPGHSESVA